MRELPTIEEVEDINAALNQYASIKRIALERDDAQKLINAARLAVQLGLTQEMVDGVIRGDIEVSNGGLSKTIEVDDDTPDGPVLVLPLPEGGRVMEEEEREAVQ